MFGQKKRIKELENKIREIERNTEYYWIGKPVFDICGEPIRIIKNSIEIKDVITLILERLKLEVCEEKEERVFLKEIEDKPEDE